MTKWQLFERSIFFSDFLHFDMSLLLFTVTLRGVSNKHCLLSLFSFKLQDVYHSTDSAILDLPCQSFCFHSVIVWFLFNILKVKSMQRSGTEAIRTQLQPSKP